MNPVLWSLSCQDGMCVCPAKFTPGRILVALVAINGHLHRRPSRLLSDIAHIPPALTAWGGRSAQHDRIWTSIG
jgi:hypothetical protein